MLDNQFVYTDINNTVYNITNKNETTQTICGDVREIYNNNFNLNYSSDNKYYVHAATESFESNNYTIYYVIVHITITKPANTNISFYQLNNQISRNDDTVAFPANNGLTDTFVWIYLTSSTITNSTKLKFYLQCFDESENVLNISNLNVNLSVKCYPVI